MKQAILISTGLLLITPFIHAEKNKDKKPNVVFILADDLGYGDLSCYGQEKFGFVEDSFWYSRNYIGSEYTRQIPSVLCQWQEDLYPGNELDTGRNVAAFG